MRKLASLAAVLWLLSAAAGCGTAPAAVSRTAAVPGYAVGDRAAAFQLTDLAGKQIALSHHEPTLLYFMAAWCSSCWAGEEHLAALYPRFAHQIRFVSLDVTPGQDTPAALAQVQKRYGGPWPHAFAPAGLVTAYGVTSLDTAILVGADGRILGRWVSPTPQVLAAALAAAVHR